MTSVPVYRCPRRFLFIASIGNPAPYTGTRHSAGHVLLDAVRSSLQERIGLVQSSSGSASSSSSSSPSSQSIFYATWKSPSLMNVSGPPVLRQLKTWLADRQKYFNSAFHHQPQYSKPAEAGENSNPPLLRLLKGPQAEPIDVDVREMTRFRPTLVILHDELEAQPGKLKVRLGGPEEYSLRGHRGLISVIESLRGARLLMSSNNNNNNRNSTSLSILRVGIGIGRPTSRERDAVADYVLSKLSPRELKALQDTVPQVVDLLVKEMYREGDD